MADQQQPESEDAWLDQLREALAETSESSAPEVDESATIDELEHVLAAPDPVPVVDAPVPEPVPVTEQPSQPSVGMARMLESMERMTRAFGQLSERVDRFEATERSGSSAAQTGTLFDQAELETMVADAMRQAILRAQATGAGTTRLEAEVRVLEETVGKLSKRVGEMNLATTTRDRPDTDGQVERLADAAEAVQGQLTAAAEARKSFEAGVDKMLRHAREGDGDNVAWTDVMLLTHELRSRVDDLDDQHRRAMRELSEWQSIVDDRLTSLRAELIREVRSLRDPA